MNAVSGRAVFEVIDRDAASHDPLADGAWSVVEAPEEEVSFDASGAPSAETPVVWRVRLDALDGAERSLTAETHRAEALDARLSTASQRAKEELASPRASAMIDAPLEAVSFSATEGESDEGESSPGAVEKLLDGLWRRASRFARIETSIGGRDVASTDVTFLGEVSTTLRVGVTADEAKAHQRAVETALATRRAWARIVIETLRVASVILSGNAFMALPAAWRFVRKIMAEAKELERLQAA